MGLAHHRLCTRHAEEWIPDENDRVCIFVESLACDGELIEYVPAEVAAENARLRELYENAVGNRERFGWTINHLLECEEALRVAEEQLAGAVEVSSKALRLAEALYRAVEFETGDGQAIADEIKALGGKTGNATGLGAVDLLRDVANSGVAFEDSRLKYVEVQIDRATWNDLASYRGP